MSSLLCSASSSSSGDQILQKKSFKSQTKSSSSVDVSKRRFGARPRTKLEAIIDPTDRSFDEFMDLRSSSDDGSIRCSIDGDDFTVSKAEMEAELLRKKMASMGGEMLRDPKDFVSTHGQRVQCGVHFGICSLLAMRGVYLDAIVMDGDVGAIAALSLIHI